MASRYVGGSVLCMLGAAQPPTVALPVPFAQAALWAAELPALRLCDLGVDDRPEGCPAQPEHGGAGFLSTVFTWRYVLNNVRALLAAQEAVGSGVDPRFTSAKQHILVLVQAMDQLMQMPVVSQLADITRAARQLVNDLRPYLEIQPPVILSLPAVTSRQRWPWPSDGQTSLGNAAFTLRTGARMPAVGFGTWRLWAKDAYEPVRWALEAGYRHLDTAEGYANEAEIGKAIVDSGIPREEIFIATKASSVPKGLTDLGHAADVFAFQLAQLGTHYVDLYMLHTPPQDPTQLQLLWQIMESFYDEGRARALGVSNCDVRELQFILSFARIPPAYVQNLFKIYKPGEQIFTDDVVAFAHSNGMAFMGYSVQTEWPHVMSPLEDPHVLALSASVGRTPSQVLHRWALQRGVGVIPKSATRSRILENAKLLDFELNEAAMQMLDGLATLSESEARLTKPQSLEDVFGLSRISMVEPTLSITTGSTRDKGFPYTAIRDHILSTDSAHGPEMCRQQCLGDLRCMAWEVCPLEAGCEGCYLIAHVSSPPMQIPGWHDRAPEALSMSSLGALPTNEAAIERMPAAS